MKHWKPLLIAASKSGLRKGVSGYVWMMKILLPISFATMLLDYSGWLTAMDVLLRPLMSVLSLPPVAAFPLIVGMATNIYGAVAVMAILPLGHNDMTLIAIFLLIAHNLPQEAIIQGKSGMNGFKTIAIRLVAAVLTVMVCARFLPPETVTTAHYAASGPATAFLEVLRAWGWQTLKLCGQIFAIIMPLMVIIENLKAFRLIPHLLKVCHPALRLMGLDRRVGMLWLTAGMFGISYGAAVIVEEARENQFAPDDLARLHVSIGINHAMIEDPCLFLPLGIGVFWLWIPRLVTAILAVRLLALWQRWRPAPARHKDLHSEA